MPPAFTRADFQIFEMGEFQPQMDALWKHISPKLTAWGEALAPELEKLLEHEVYVHVARHARRRTNPAPETWAAFSFNQRGYKKYPALLLSASRSGLQMRVAVKYEGFDIRRRLTEILDLERIMKQVGDGVELRHFLGNDPDEGPPPAFDGKDREAWEKILERASLKTKAFDVGHALAAAPATKLTVKKAMGIYAALAPIYHPLQRAAEA